jgi:hypothetical protein
MRLYWYTQLQKYCLYVYLLPDISLEPCHYCLECAAIYTMFLLYNTIHYTKFSTSNGVVVCSIGGGTVNCILYRGLKLEPLEIATRRGQKLL